MAESRSIVKKIDQQFFNLASKIKASNAYQNYLAQLESFSDDQQRSINQTISIVIISIPLIICLVLFFQVISTKEQINTYLDLTKRSDDLININNQISLQSRNIINAKNLIDKTAFESELRSLLNGSGIKLENIQLTTFTTSNVMNSVSRGDVTINFNELTSSQFYSLLNNLTNKEKIKIVNIDVKKNIEKNLLQGSLTLVYFFKEN